MYEADDGSTHRTPEAAALADASHEVSEAATNLASACELASSDQDEVKRVLSQPGYAALVAELNRAHLRRAEAEERAKKTQPTKKS